MSAQSILLVTLTDPGTLIAIGGGAVAGAILLLIGLSLRRHHLIGRARREAEEILKRAQLEGREQLAHQREELEAQFQDEREQLDQRQQRLSRREEKLDTRVEALDRREQAIRQQEAEAETEIQRQKEALQDARRRQKEEALRLSELTPEEARRLCLEKMEDDVRHEAEQLIQREIARAREEAEEKGRQIILEAIERYAGEHTIEHTGRTIELPSDDMKGRVIGREGRNIRAFQAAAGVDVIVDDTPGVVTVSCFDPVRRAVAAEAMSRLVEEGRIHPGKIEEAVEKSRANVEQQIDRRGKQATLEADVHGLAPEIVQTMGRLQYRTSFGQNILQHSVEVAAMAGVIAGELGLDPALARRCGFLHDIGKAMDHEREGGHPKIGMEFARRHKEPEAVLNAIGGHHHDIPATTPYTPIVVAADAISGARPGARRENLDRYVKRLEELEAIAGSLDGVQEAFAIQAGREVRVIVDPENVDDKASHVIARKIARRVSEEMSFPGEIQITVLREMRTVTYAK